MNKKELLALIHETVIEVCMRHSFQNPGYGRQCILHS